MTRFNVQPGDNAPFHDDYVRLFKDQDIVPFLHLQRGQFASLIAGLPESRGDYAYAPGKWTIRQVIQHVIDSERVFAFRLLAMSRGEQQPIPGFDQDDYMAAVDLTERTIVDQRHEFESVRDATLTLVHSLSQAQLALHGNVSGHVLVARAVPYIIAGHLEHHRRILHERYAVAAVV